MKNKHVKTTLSILLFALIGFTNCNTDDEPHWILGTWNLMQVSGGFAGTVQDYDPGDVLWTFDADSLRIEDNTTATVNEYPYSMVNYEDHLFLVIDYDTHFPWEYHPSVETTGTEMTLFSGLSITISDNDTTLVAINDGFDHFLER